MAGMTGTLALNSGSSNGLDELLLPGLDPVGVPNSLGEQVRPFTYGSTDSFISAVKDDNIGIVFMEFSRTTQPDTQFLEFIRNYCNKHKLVFNF